MKTLDQLQAIRDDVKARVAAKNIRIIVGYATCGIAAGARPVLAAAKEEAQALGLASDFVVQAGCIGVCAFEPIVEIVTGGQKFTYVHMTADKTRKVIQSHVKDGKPTPEYTYNHAVGAEPNKTLPETAFYHKQKRIVLRNCGVIDPESIDEYLAVDGYKAYEKAAGSMTRQEVIDTLKKSGLRGRGGAGFPTGLKWQFTMDAPGSQKYVVCNADEGDPGAFMDRSVLEGDPHAVLEAMMLGGYAVGATKGYIYIRAEYPLAIERLKIAIDQARSYGILGDNAMGFGHAFDIELRLGAGAFVCGEETALLASIEGKRGEPKQRPPFPAVKGLFEKPTLINNVETYANVAQIILKGWEWFASVGTEKSKGTKVFALGGKINNTGLVEIPIGTTLRTVIEEIGGGIPKGKKFKAAQTGGPSGGCIPAAHIDVPMDYENLTALGSMMGSGGLIVMDEDNCMVDIAKFYLEFTVDESCGKCTPCRIGNKRLFELLEKVTDGKADLEDFDKIQALSAYIKENSLCGLGQTAPNPVLSTLRYFKDEYEAHVVDKKCPAGVCKAFLSYKIIPEKCIGCTLCKRACPTGAVTGELKGLHVIDPEKCIKCNACFTACKKDAILK
ncbi:MAG: NADH-quinone oxidoreductase subunit NuoF [Firmicutes bacterium]|nr:NADH-quinone oxidoreductase subunit NuoF [Bacillota bacterium]